ncbi:MAG: hypothetical protein K0S05_381 [Agromyces sp.]|nr:hypothetical protein [Agromyces sp.]
MKFALVLNCTFARSAMSSVLSHASGWSRKTCRISAAVFR